MSAPTTDKAGIRQTVRALRAAGYTLDSVEHEEDVTVSNEKEAVHEATSCDEAWLWVKDPEGKLHGVYFVLGNDPDEVICDYHVSLEPVIGPLQDSWND